MKSSERIIISRSEILYYLFFGLLFFAKGIGLYDGQASFKLLLEVAMVCLVAKLVIERYNIYEMAMMAFIAVLGIAAYKASGDKGLILYAFMVIGLKNIDTKRLFKVALAIWSTAFIGLWLISLTRMESTVYRVANKIGLDHIFRWGMGYPHPNVLHITYLIFVALIFLVVGDKIKLKHFIGLAVGNIFVFLYSLSYTGVIIVFLLLIAVGYLKVLKNLCTLEKILISIVFPACVVFSLVGPVVLKGNLFNIVDKLVNTRLSLAKYYLNSDYISWFGERISEITTATLTMDNSFVFGFIAYGIITFAIICAVYMYVIYTLVKQNRMLEVVIISVFAIAGLTEPFLFNTSFKNIGFIFVGEILLANMRGKGKRTICIFKKLNKEYNFSNILMQKKMSEWKELIKKNASILGCSMIVGGVICAILYAAIVEQPSGYVIRRSRCEDISEEIILYGENSEDYSDYYCMENFGPEDEIQYFTGDIVLMEFIRKEIMCILLGSFVSGAGVLIILQIQKGNKSKVLS